MFQRDLLALFDSFHITTATDYHRLPPTEKPAFVRMLYRVFTTDTRLALTDMSHAGGVKFHFATAGDLTASNPNLPNETFLKKMSFYANRALITFPFREITDKSQMRALKSKHHKAWTAAAGRTMLLGPIHGGRDGYGGYIAIPTPGKVYTIDPIAFDDFLTVACRLRPALDAGIATLLPLFPDAKRRFSNRALGLTSANFRLRDLKMQFEETISPLDMAGRRKSGFTQLLLPHFTNVPMERILEIRTKEDELYWEMQRRMEQLLRGASTLESERRLLAFMREADQGVRELHRKFKSIQTNYSRRNVYMRIKFLSAALVLLAPVEARETLGAILGSISAFDYLTAREDRAKQMYETRDNKFYLPWLVFKTAET